MLDCYKDAEEGGSYIIHVGLTGKLGEFLKAAGKTTQFNVDCYSYDNDSITTYTDSAEFKEDVSIYGEAILPNSKQAEFNELFGQLHLFDMIGS